MNESSKNERKKPYLKPEAQRFPLRPEEAVLGFCKTAVTSGPNALGSCKPAGFCQTAGS